MELLLVVVVVAFAINILASAAVSWNKGVVSWAAAGALVLTALLGVRRLSAVNDMRTVEGILIYDSDTKSFVSTPGYRFSERAYEFLNAAFLERPGFKEQWVRQPLDGIAGQGSDYLANRRTSIQLSTELIEYILLEELSGSLSEFFASNVDAARSGVSTFRREDIPKVLLSNRFLELFSQSMDDRGFKTSNKLGEGEIVAAYEEGRIFHQFELRLPKGSRVDRQSDGGILIDGNLLRVTLKVVFSGFVTSLPGRFEEYYLGLGGSADRFRCLTGSVTATISVKRRAWLARRGWTQYLWVVQFLDRIEECFSHEAFLKRINWPAVEATVRILERRSSPAAIGAPATRGGPGNQPVKEVEPVAGSSAAVPAAPDAARAGSNVPSVAGSREETPKTRLAQKTGLDLGLIRPGQDFGAANLLSRVDVPATWKPDAPKSDVVTVEVALVNYGPHGVRDIRLELGLPKWHVEVDGSEKDPDGNPRKVFEMSLQYPEMVRAYTLNFHVPKGTATIPIHAFLTSVEGIVIRKVLEVRLVEPKPQKKVLPPAPSP